MKIILLVVGIVFIIVSGILDTREKLTTRDYFSDLFYTRGILFFTWWLILPINPELKPQKKNNLSLSANYNKIH